MARPIQWDDYQRMINMDTQLHHNNKLLQAKQFKFNLNGLSFWLHFSLLLLY
jgi:hypothetical protein